MEINYLHPAMDVAFFTGITNAIIRTKFVTRAKRATNPLIVGDKDGTNHL